MKKLRIIFGTKCNLNCKYCYQSHSNDEISYEVLDKIIENINNSNEEFFIHLFGGEPLLYLDKIFYLLDRIEYKKHIFCISTNGVLKENFKKLENKLGYPVLNLLSNKENKDYSKLNEKSAFRWIATKDNLDELEEKVDWLIKEYGNNFSIYCNFYEKWTTQDLERINKLEGKGIKILKPQYNNSFPCNSINITTVNWNGDLLLCHRKLDSIIGNIFKDNLKESSNKECVFKDDIKRNFLLKNNDIDTRSLCEQDIVFYC